MDSETQSVKELAPQSGRVEKLIPGLVDKIVHGGIADPYALEQRLGLLDRLVTSTERLRDLEAHSWDHKPRLVP